MTLREWLRQNDLVLYHPGHGHNEVGWPVLFSEMERLDAAITIEPVRADRSQSQ